MNEDYGHIKWEHGDTDYINVEPGSPQESLFGTAGVVGIVGPPEGMTIFGKYYKYGGCTIRTVGGPNDGRAVHLVKRDVGSKFWVDEQTGEESELTEDDKKKLRRTMDI